MSMRNYSRDDDFEIATDDEVRKIDRDFNARVGAVLIVVALLVALFFMSQPSAAKSTVEAHWAVNRLKGTSQVATHTGATAEEAWSKCTAAIPKPQATTSQITGKVTHTCQTPRYIASETFSANAPPPPPADGDSDGVPDSTDNCPTVAASMPDGCPVTPPPPQGILMSWTAVTKNTDGSALTNLKGYGIYASKDLNTIGAGGVFVEVPGATAYRITLEPGMWYLAVAAMTTDGRISALSNVVRKEVQ